MQLPVSSGTITPSPLQPQPQQAGWFGKLLDRSSKASAWYQELRHGGSAEDFSDLDEMGFLQVCPTDLHGRAVVMVSAQLYTAHILQLARTLRYLVHKLHDVVQQPYTLLWVHTRATYWNNCPSAWWLWRTYESLPQEYRQNLAVVHVLHCSLSLWGAALTALPWWSDGLWSKVNWVSRVEFLWDHLDKREQLPLLPQYVLEHDEDLERQPLADYGIVTAPEMNTALTAGPTPAC